MSRYIATSEDGNGRIIFEGLTPGVTYYLLTSVQYAEYMELKRVAEKPLRAVVPE